MARRFSMIIGTILSRSRSKKFDEMSFIMKYLGKFHDPAQEARHDNMI